MARTAGKVKEVEKVWLNNKEAASYLGCSERFLRDLKDTGEISFAKYKNTIWYNLESIERFLNRHKVI